MKKIIILLTFLIPILVFAQQKISELRLRSASGTGASDSFPYVNASIPETDRILLSDLINLPAFQTKFGTLQTSLPLTTKGDLLTRNSSSYIRFPVCPDGQSMQADSTQTSGWKCSTSIGSANVSLSNLSTTAINTSLLPNTDEKYTIGTASLRWLKGFISEFYDSNNLKIAEMDTRILYNSVGTTIFDFSGNSVNTPSIKILASVASTAFIQISAKSSTASYPLTLPTSQGGSGQVLSNDGAGTLYWTSTMISNLTVVDGGNTTYQIKSIDQHVRSGTTLTTNRTWTLPSCTSSNIGERHTVKNTPSQSYNVILTASTADNIDGSSSTTLVPGDSTPVICSKSDGTWDIE